MAASLNKITYSILNIASSGVQSTSFRITEAQCDHWVAEVRSMLISQDIQKRKDFSDVWYQSIECIRLQQVDISECCDVVIGCKVLRSVSKLPRTIEWDGDNLIKSVRALDGEPIGKYNRFSQKYSKFNKWSKNKPGWFIKNDYLYIVNSDTLEIVAVDGIFEDPKDLSGYSTCTGTACFTRDSIYPVSMKMANEIANYIIKTKILPLMQFPQDLLNNMKDDVILK